MRVFVAGGSGVVGSRLIPALLEAGHEVSAGTRSEARAPGIRALGAEPVVADALDREAIVGAVVDARPEAVIHQLTAIPARLNPRHPERDFALTNRLRSEGTDNLLAAARAARAGRFLAQSFAGWPFAREGGPVKEEDAPLTTDVPAKLVPLLDGHPAPGDRGAGRGGAGGDRAALRLLLRLGHLGRARRQRGGRRAQAADADRGRRRRRSGPSCTWTTWPRPRWPPWSAAGAGSTTWWTTNPLPSPEWLPALAEAAGARAPRRVPGWLARLAAGEHAVVMLNEIRGASNAKARRELGWEPRHPSWRQGFREVLGEGAGA